MGTIERVQVDYDHKTTYQSDEKNVIGATTDLILRSVQAHSDLNCKYVRKFGTDYLIKNVTSLEDPVDVNLTIACYARDGTLLGSRTGGGAYVDGSAVATAQGIYIVCTASGGAVTLNIFGPVYSIHTDVDAGGKPFYLPTAEVIADGDSITFYLSDTHSSYYDSAMRYGGARHTPDGTELKPYFTIQAAETALGGAFEIVTVLDSETYDEQIDIDSATTSGNSYIQAALGQTPTITSGVGARITREVSTQYNNTTAIYFNENGDNANNGKWQNPKLTIANAITNRGTNSVIYGGDGATVSEGIFDESNTINGAFTLESDYGYIPSMTKTTGSIITITHINGNINGFKISGSESGVLITVNAYAGSIKNCICYNNEYGFKIWEIYNFVGVVEDCVFYGNDSGIHFNVTEVIVGGIIKNCIFYNNGTGFQCIYFRPFNGTIENCICYNNSGHGINIRNINFGGLIKNCTCYNNSCYGIIFHDVTAFTGTIQNCISYGNQTFDLYETGGVAPTITESNYGTNSGFTIGGGCITTDPEFCKTDLPYKLGISANSGAYRTDTSSDDMGAHLRIIELNKSDITINGFILDGQSQYNNAIFIADSADHIDNFIKWCTVKDFQGIAIDLYDDDTNTDTQILNSIIKDNGNGIKLAYGGNTIKECLIYNNSKFGIHSDWTGQTFNHNVFYNNYYGLYLESNSGGIIYKNNISHQNSLYGIYSEVALIVTYSCITDAVNANIDITNSSNIIDDPLFINIVFGSEDFHLKSEFRGYSVNSVCIDAADDGLDMGAWDVDDSIFENYWKKYQFVHNPRTMNEGLLPKGVIKFDDAYGNLSGYMKSDRITLPLVWAGNSAMSEVQRKKIRYFSTHVPSVQNERTEAECEFRIHVLPVNKYGTGIADIDATAKTLTDSDENWVENEKKGWYVTIVFKSETGGYVKSATKAMMKSGAGWNVNQWIGYYLHYNGYYYYIKSNSHNTLILSDPLDTLEDSNNKTYFIVKYFKIETNDETILTLTDNQSELITGEYGYYINFVKCKIQKPGGKYIQKTYDYGKEYSKTGIAITFEEVD